MTRRTRTMAVMLVTFVLVGLGVARLNATSATPAPPSEPDAVSMSNWTFQGCWSRTGSSPCLDVYTDGSGNYWVCKPCGQTGNPNPNKCQKTSAAVIQAGRWCS